MYYMKPLLIRPSKNVLFYIIYNADGEWISRIDKKEDAERVLACLNNKEAKVLPRKSDKISWR